MNVSFEGIGERLVTFLASSVTKGHVVKVSAAGTVSECSAGDAFDGVCLFTDSGTAAVRLGGFVTVGYSSTAPGYGRAILVADGSGGVKTAESGDTYVVVDKDTTAKTVTIIL
jgi:hypothetical protein